MGTEASRAYEVVNTVNTALNNEYDFGIHAAGCQDVKRAIARGCTVEKIEADGTPGAIECVREDLVDGGFEREAAEAFSIHVFGCCARGGS